MSKTLRIDLTDFKHPNGLLTAKSFSHLNKNSQAVWDCECDCGKKLKVQCWLVHTGKTRSCGCLRKEGKLHEYHGEFKTVSSWASDPRSQVEYCVLRNRLYMGWEIGKALTTPLTRKRQKRSTVPGKIIVPGRNGTPLKELIGTLKG